MRTTTRSLLILLAAVITITACGRAEDSGDARSGPVTSTPPTPSSTPPGMASPRTGIPSTQAEPVDIPDTPVGLQAQWVLEQLALDTGPDAGTAAQRFNDEFLSQVPAEEVAAAFDQMRATGPYTVTSYTVRADARQATLGLQSDDGTTWHLHTSVDDAGTISGLLLQPASSPEVNSWDELDAALDELDADVSVYAARARNGTWEPVHDVASTEPHPVGSVFKLYVLGAVQQAVLDGDVSWQDTVTVTDDLRSLPSGQLQNAETGTTVSIAEAAEKMISISDNTATDMLIDLAGRESVEAAATAMGHHDPALLTPLLATRELFQIGWGDPELRERWRDGSTSQRRALLAGLPGGTLDIDPTSVTDPVWTYGIDWFATATDVANAHRALQELAAKDDTTTVRDLLAANPGVQIDPQTWSYAAYKGGSAPGVLALSWYVENADGVGHVLVIQLATDDPTALADQLRVSTVAQQGLTLLSQQ